MDIYNYKPHISVHSEHHLYVHGLQLVRQIAQHERNPNSRTAPSLHAYSALCHSRYLPILLKFRSSFSLRSLLFFLQTHSH